MLSKVSYAQIMVSERSQNPLEKARDFWCQLFHDEPMWPVNGHYQCRRCLRYHPVSWEQPVKKQLAEAKEFVAALRNAEL